MSDYQDEHITEIEDLLKGGPPPTLLGILASIPDTVHTGLKESGPYLVMALTVGYGAAYVTGNASAFQIVAGSIVQYALPTLGSLIALAAVAKALDMIMSNDAGRAMIAFGIVAYVLAMTLGFAPHIAPMPSF